MNLFRASARAATTRPFASTACIWITRLGQVNPYPNNEPLV